MKSNVDLWFQQAGFLSGPYPTTQTEAVTDFIAGLLESLLAQAVLSGQADRGSVARAHCVKKKANTRTMKIARRNAPSARGASGGSPDALSRRMVQKKNARIGEITSASANQPKPSRLRRMLANMPVAIAPPTQKRINKSNAKIIMQQLGLRLAHAV